MEARIEAKIEEKQYLNQRWETSRNTFDDNCNSLIFGFRCRVGIKIKKEEENIEKRAYHSMWLLLVHVILPLA